MKRNDVFAYERNDVHNGDIAYASLFFVFLTSGFIKERRVGWLPKLPVPFPAFPISNQPPMREWLKPTEWTFMCELRIWIESKHQRHFKSKYVATLKSEGTANHAANR